MEIYYDADCNICNKCKDFVLRNKKSDIEFFDIHNSRYQNELNKTIVLIFGGKEYRYGASIKVIFKHLKYPYKLLSYLPTFILTLGYIILREARKRFSRNICKI